MLDTNEIFVGAQGFAPSVKLEIISIALFMKWYEPFSTPLKFANQLGSLYANFSHFLLGYWLLIARPLY